MRIFLVRHGESAGNVDKDLHRTMADHAIHLSTRGIEQAHAAGRLLRPHVEEVPRSRLRIWTSPYKRTRQTAAAIREELGAGVEIKEQILLCEQQFGVLHIHVIHSPLIDLGRKSRTRTMRGGAGCVSGPR
jgi:broad specificity phosphatase PhoE